MIYKLKSQIIKELYFEMSLSYFNHIEKRATSSLDTPTTTHYDIYINFGNDKSIKCLTTGNQNEANTFGKYLSNFLDIELKERERTYSTQL